MLLLPFLFLIVTAKCFGGSEIPYNDPGLSVRSGITYYQAEPFTGKIRQPIPAVGEVRLTPYKDGILHGTMVARGTSGQLLLRSEYAAGKKHGLQRTWYADGRDRSFGEFANGHYIGDHWAWHQNGKVMEFNRYDDRGKIIATKKWRSNGLIYMNLVFRDGQEFGLPGSKVCNPTSETAGTDL